MLCVCVCFCIYFYLVFQYTDGKRKEFQSTIDRNLRTFIILPILLHPKSKGSIRLQSDDPFDSPLIDPNYLDHPDDVKTMLRGITLCSLKLNIFVLISFLVFFWFLIIRIFQKYANGKSQTFNWQTYYFTRFLFISNMKMIFLKKYSNSKNQAYPVNQLISVWPNTWSIIPIGVVLDKL